jgi:hypothetical protein
MKLRIAYLIGQIVFFAVAAVFLGGTLSGCWLTGGTKKPEDPRTVVAPVGGEAKKLGEQVKTEIPAAVLEQQAQQRRAASKAVAQFEAITHSAGTITTPEEQNARTAITESAEQGKRELGGESTPEDRAAALAAANAFLAGEIERGKVLIANARAEADEAKKARDAANEAVRVALENAKRQADAAEAEAKRIAADNQKRFDELARRVTAAEERAKNAEDEARKKALGWLSWVELGLGAVFVLVGAATAYLTQGREWLRALIAAGAGGFCFSCYWAQHQPWFKWFVIGGIVLGVVALGVWIWREFADAKDVTTKQQALAELERVRNAGRKVVAELDEWKSEAGESVKPLLERLSRRMNDDEKIAIHDLRRESAVAVKAKGKT